MTWRTVRLLGYYDSYVSNIETWIPWCLELNSFCAQHVLRQLSHRRNRRPTAPTLLQVGFGIDSGLTRLLFDHLADTTAFADGLNANPLTSMFYGWTAHLTAPQKVALVSRFAEYRNVPYCVIEGEFNEALAFALAGGAKTVDVLCGSLALLDMHIINGETRTEKLAHLLRTADRFVAEDGVMLLADIFRPDDDAAWDRESACCKEEMERVGMTEDQISTFIRRDPEEMEFFLNESEIQELASRYRFTAEFVRLERWGGLCILTRVGNRRPDEETFI
jgi:hypothetical protein